MKLLTNGTVIWTVFRAGWRPMAGWACTAILIVNGVVLPFCGKQPADWRAMAMFIGTLMGLAVTRTMDKMSGHDQ